MAANDLTTLAAVETFLTLESGNEDEALLAQLITAASQQIETVCGRSFVSQSFTETRDGTGAGRLILRNTPVTAIASLWVDTTNIPLSSGFGSATAPTPGYTWQANGIIDLIGYRFRRGRSNVVAGYTAGYATIPADLGAACVEAVAWMYEETDRIGKTSEGMAGQTTTFKLTALSPRAQDIVNRYVRVAPGYP